MNAVIMAGGEGTRLRPLTCNIPKPMVPVANKPVMEHIVKLLKKHDITDIAVTLQYMPEKIKDFFKNGNDLDVNIQYFTEKHPLGTAGSVRNVQNFLSDTFVVISGDALTDINLKEVIEFHKNNDAFATIVLKKVISPCEYGIVICNNNGKIVNFLEKPNWSEVFSDTVNTGIYILSKEIFNYYSENEVFDFSKDLFPLLMKDNKPLYGYISEDYWCDIGDLNAYIQAHIDILDGKVKIDIPGQQSQNGIWVDKNSIIEEGATLVSPCIIGQNVKIKSGATVGNYSVIGNSNILISGSNTKRSILWENCFIDRNVQLRGTIVCNKVFIKENTTALENCVIGENTLVNRNVEIKPDVKIWPNKNIDEGLKINSNIVWGTKIKRTIFGYRGIKGDVNIDITPEFASKLASSYASIFKKNSKICISCDGTAASGMLKNSFLSGISSVGMQTLDFGVSLLPITRSAIRFYKADGGIHISTSLQKNSQVFIDFLNSYGSNISSDIERKIDNAFSREDYKRCEISDIIDVKVISNYNEYYLLNIINSINSKHLNYKIAFAKSFNLINEMSKKILTELGCEFELVELDLVNKDINSFSNYIKNNNFNLGIIIEDNSEKMLLIDSKGRLITEDIFIGLISIVLLNNIKQGTFVAPISSSDIIEKIVSQYDGNLVRSKTSLSDIMRTLEKCTKENMLEQFTLNFDAMASLVKILDFINRYNYALSDLVDLIPNFYMSKKEVECPWDAKGKVIRQILQDSKNKFIETFDGIKVRQKDGWVLILPNSEKPTCSIISEGASAEIAEELTNIYAKKIQEISKN